MFSAVIYQLMGVLALFTFGSTLMPSVLTNIDSETSAVSFVIRAIFIVVLACHIPYIFFAQKESLLIMVDEARNSSMSE